MVELFNTSFYIFYLFCIISNKRFNQQSLSLTTVAFNFYLSKECDNNTFGVNCTGVCGHCTEKEQCHHVNGTCLHGCEPGFNGFQCDQGNY